MTKKITISLLVVILTMSMCLALTACNNDKVDSFTLQYAADNSIKRLSGDKTREVLKDNPSRGFSINLYMTLNANDTSYKYVKAFPNPCKHAGHNADMSASEHFANEFKKYETLSPNMVVLTVFLTNFIETDINNNALEQMTSALRYFRDNKKSVILKFAYKHSDPVAKEDGSIDENYTKDPSVETIVKHIAVFKEYLSSNTVVDSAVAAFRLSFVGEDGCFQFHNYNSEEVAVITNAFANMVPTNKKTSRSYTNYYSQAPDVKTKTTSSEYDKLLNMGFYNNLLNGKENNFSSGGNRPSSDMYRQYINESRLNINSASVLFNTPNIDGKAVLRAMKDGHFTSFDLSNMYNASETTLDDELKRKATTPLLEAWATTLITKEEIMSMGLPYYDEWFLNSDGTHANRYVLDYLRDFLGYNLSASNLTLAREPRQIKNEHGVYETKDCTIVKFTITNYGMAAPLLLNKMEIFVKNNATGKFIFEGQALPASSQYDPKVLVSGGQIMFEQVIVGDIDHAEGVNPEQAVLGHSIGVRLCQDRGSRKTYAKLNNDVPYDTANNISWIYSTVK